VAAAAAVARPSLVAAAILFQRHWQENYFSQLAQQLGYKPSQRMLELRAMQVDWSTQMMYEDNIGFIFRRRKDTMYKQETKALARGKLGNIEQWNNQTAIGAVPCVKGVAL